MPGSSALLSPSASGVRVPGSSAPPPGLFAPLSPSAFGVRMPGLFTFPPGSSTPLSLSVSNVRILGSSAPSASGAPIPGSSAPPPGSSILPSPSVSGVHVLGSSAPLPGSSALPSPSASGVCVLGSSAPPPRSSTPLSPSVSGVRMLGSSALSPSGRLLILESSPHGLSPPFPIWLFPQTPTPVPGKQRLGQWDRIIKRASSEKAPPTFAPLLPSIEYPSPLFFLSNSFREKRSFDKAFNLDSWLLANDCIGKEIDLSFAYC